MGSGGAAATAGNHGGQPTFGTAFGIANGAFTVSTGNNTVGPGANVSVTGNFLNGLASVTAGTNQNGFSVSGVFTLPQQWGGTMFAGGFNGPNPGWNWMIAQQFMIMPHVYTHLIYGWGYMAGVPFQTQGFGFTWPTGLIWQNWFGGNGPLFNGTNTILINGPVLSGEGPITTIITHEIRY